MYCPNCAGNLEAADNEKILSQDNWGGDYWTHFCSKCKTYWHLHLSGSEVVLMATKQEQPASIRIVDDLKVELGERLYILER